MEVREERPESPRAGPVGFVGVDKGDTCAVTGSGLPWDLLGTGLL